MPMAGLPVCWMGDMFSTPNSTEGMLYSNDKGASWTWTGLAGRLSGIDDRSIPHGEVLAMTLARKAGLAVADARLQDVAGRPVALIKRFGRQGDLCNSDRR